MKQIDLLHGLYALVDDEDFDYLSQWKWFWYAGAGYPARQHYAKRTGHRRTVYLHKAIMERVHGELTGQIVDHVDLNTLNAQKSNLRLVSKSQNQMNRKPPSSNTSGFKGVSRVLKKNGRVRWHAYIQVNRRRHHLGNHDDPVDAAVAYNQAALDHFGSVALLNSLPLKRSKEVND